MTKANRALVPARLHKWPRAPHPRPQSGATHALRSQAISRDDRRSRVKGLNRESRVGEQECVVSKLLHRVWPSVNVDAESFINAAVIGLSVLSLYGAFKLSELIF